MQINAAEIGVLQQAIPRLAQSIFRLPKINHHVPAVVVAQQHGCHTASFGRALLKAKIIDPATISESVESGQDVVVEALQQWFDLRTKDMKVFDFDVQIINLETLKQTHSINDSDFVKQLGTRFAMVLTADEYCADRECRSAAEELEALCPRLFASAYMALTEASYRSMPLNVSSNILLPWRLWECDFSDIPSDDEAMEHLMEMYEEEAIASQYLPSRLLKTFGGAFCMPVRSRKHKMTQRLLTEKQLVKYCKSKNERVARVAKLTSNLRASTSVAEMADAHLPSIRDTDLDQTTVGCNVLFLANEDTKRFIDDERDYAMEKGTYSEILGLAAIPKTATQMEVFFNNLDLSLAVMRDMDALIEQISIEIEPKGY